MGICRKFGESTLNFDEIYKIDSYYFSNQHSGGMEDCIKKYNILPCKAVDLGAGEGRNSFYLAKKGFDVIAVEPSKVGAEKIKKQIKKYGYDNLHVINKKFCETENELFGIGFLVSLTCLEHMSEQELQESIQLIKRILSPNGYVYIVAFTEDDPGFKRESNNASECSKFVKHYFKKNELKSLFKDFEIIFYDEYIKEDLSHGLPHYHGKAKLIAKKP